MAGGEGTRLRPLTSNAPKPMMPIANVPMTVGYLTLQFRVLNGAGAQVGEAVCSNGLRGAGFGSDVMGSRVQALWHLHTMLRAQPQFPPLAAGEIITTGTWTEAYAIEAGQTWISEFSGISLPGLNISFV